MNRKDVVFKLINKYDLKEIVFKKDEIIVTEGEDELYIDCVAKDLGISEDNVDYANGTLSQVRINMKEVEDVKFDKNKIVCDLMDFFNIKNDEYLLAMRISDNKIIVDVESGCGIGTHDIRRCLSKYDITVNGFHKNGHFEMTIVEKKKPFSLLDASRSEIEDRLSSLGEIEYVETHNVNNTITVSFKGIVNRNDFYDKVNLPRHIGVCQYDTKTGKMFVVNKLELKGE